MNIRQADPTLTVHFSANKVARVDEMERGIRIAYDQRDRIVDIIARGRAGASRIEIGKGPGDRPRRMTYDASVDALYIYASEAKVGETEEILPDFIVDFDDDGFLIGLEFLNTRAFFSDQTMADIRNSATLL
jgi:uncharacterized protein YuzE